METKERILITVEATINALADHVWKCWTCPEDIVHWNNASDDWHTTRAENDLCPGGRFSYRMEAKDGSMGFDFSGVYNKVVRHEQIEYLMDDGRKAKILFASGENKTTIVETFEAERINPVELQRGGWQAILDNFKRYAEH
jgi:uncharacterized protein YndB with AHSA1/START domain